MKNIKGKFNKLCRPGGLVRRSLTVSTWVTIVVMFIVSIRLLFVDTVGAPIEIAGRWITTFLQVYIAFFIFFFVYLLINPSAYPEKDGQ